MELFKIKNETRVVNVKNESYDIYIGRGSKWGNPYSHKKETSAKFIVKTREEAIKKYEKYLLSNKKLFNSLHELKGKRLGCWCKPKSCHGDILKKYVEKI